MTDKKQTEYFSFKEVLLKFKENLQGILIYKRTIIVCAILFALFGGTYAFFAKPKYEGTLSFILEAGNEKSSLGAYASIASQFGINLGGSGSSLLSEDNILLLLKSRKIFEKALLSPVKIGEQTQLLGNYLITVNDFHKKWDSPETENFKFTNEIKPRQAEILQDSIFDILYEEYVIEDLQVAKIDKKAGIINVSFINENEFLTKLFLENIIDAAISFYTETSIKKSKAIVDMLQYKTDSIRGVLEKSLVEVARLKDAGIGVVRAEAKINELKKEKEVEMLYTIYTELLKNLEINKTNLIQNTPVIQIIETPNLPLKKDEKSIIWYMFWSAFIGLFLLIAGLIIKEKLKEV